MNETQLRNLMLRKDSTLRDALSTFEKTGLRAVIVCDSADRMLAVATEGDVRRAMLNGCGLISLLLPISNTSPKFGKFGMSREQ